MGARVPVTRAEGPGARYALWLQGCSIRCPGCCNPHLFDPAGGERVAAGVLLAEMEAVRGEIEGITVLGGEPMDQPEGLLPVLRGARDLGLSVVVFSGFTLEDLRARPDAAVQDVLATIDVLVDGRYEASRPETERLSHYFSARLPEQFDAVLHFDQTRAVEPLEPGAAWKKGEVPETFPSGL